MTQLPLESTPDPLYSKNIPYGLKGRLLSPFGCQEPGNHKLQSESFKELTSKIAWALGTAYGLEYSKKDGPVGGYARMVAHAVTRDHGYRK